MHQYTIDITDHQTSPIIEHEFLDRVIRQVLHEEQVDVATISLAIVTDAEIHGVNRQFLGHDYPTDVISFRLNEQEATKGIRVSADEIADLSATPCLGANTIVDGELIVSAETAIREAIAHGWSPKAELVLYVVHGLLHLCGYDDLTDEVRPLMRSRERDLLALWGFCPTGLEQ